MRLIPHTLGFLVIGLLLSDATAQRANLSGISAAKQPVISEAHGISAAAIFPTHDSARIVVSVGATGEVSSPAFDFPSIANYGAAWVARIEIKSSAAFTVLIRVRQTCGPGIYDYTFAKQGNSWLLARLDREESQCTDAGILPDWKRSYNYLRGTVVSTKFQKSRALKPTTKPRALKVVPLTEFRALDARHEGDA
jgi:hypothetical protein